MLFEKSTKRFCESKCPPPYLFFLYVVDNVLASVVKMPILQPLSSRSLVKFLYRCTGGIWSGNACSGSKGL